jgi:hypothetical protein
MTSIRTKPSVQALVNSLTKRRPGDYSSTSLQVGDQARSLPDYSNTLIEYKCPVCHESYKTFEEAETCRTTPFDACGLEVGSLVIIPSEWRGYYDGNWYDSAADDPWVLYRVPEDIKNSDHFRRVGWHVPWYVVTAVHNGRRADSHRTLVTVCSLMDGRLDFGWNPADGDGHIPMFRPGLPKEKQLNMSSSTWWDEDDIQLVKHVLEAEPSKKLLRQARQLAEMHISTEVLL